MIKLFSDTNKYEAQSDPPAVVEIFHGGTRDAIRKILAETGVTWSEFVFGRSYEMLTRSEIAEIERRVLEGGYRYAPSATISVQERPEAYIEALDADGSPDDFSFDHEGAIVEPAEASGRQRRGQGDNVVEYPANIIGSARYYRSIKDVMEGLSNGVPEKTVAIIDDSGGTLTAPILEQFYGVICAGGTVKSHLGILTREYGIPCLMNARISGIRNGDLVEVEVSGAAKTMEAYQSDGDMSVRVWVHPR